MTKWPPDVSVVVVSYNALEWLSQCLAAIRPAHSPDLVVEVVVVDNDSGPDVQRYLAEAPHGVTVLQQRENLGFGRACNLGIRHSSGTRVMLLNPDAILRPGAIDALVSFLDADPQRGLVGGRTLRLDGTLDPSSCWAAPTLWSWFCSASGLTTMFRRSRVFDPESIGAWARDDEREVDIVTGCLLMASRSIWELLDGFDPDFFMYGEDADLSLRARRAGLHPSITPSAEAVHAVGASSPNKVGKQRLLLRGKASYARKHWTPLRRAVGITLLESGVALRAVAEKVAPGESTTWRTLWSERREWAPGWPASNVSDRARTPAGSTPPADRVDLPET